MRVRSNFSKLLMVFSVTLLLGACSDSESNVDAQDTMTREGISDGPLADVYQGDMGPASGTQADLVVNVGDRIFFGYDRYDLTPEARLTLEKQAEWMQQYPALSLTIEGHADERGTREYNLALGERRANSVKNYLVALGVSPTRLTTISYGKERPAVPGANETAWAQNRRGVTKVN